MNISLVFWEDFIITLTDKADGVDLTIREEYSRRVLKTVSPYGLNAVASNSHVLARPLYLFPRQEYY